MVQNIDLTPLAPDMNGNGPKRADPTPTTNATPNLIPTGGVAGPANVVPGSPNTPNQINVADYSGQIVTNPSLFLNNDTTLSNKVPQLDPNTPGTTIDPNASKYQMNIPGLNKIATTAKNTSTVGNVGQKGTATYDAATSYDQIAAQDMQGAKGQVSDGALIDPNEVPQADTNALATGKNADGTVNETGKALNDYASQNMSSIIDTSTVAGKLLAQQLGEGNYLDSKATLQGQMDLISKQFVDANGNPTIPTWAQGTARAVSKMVAFGGVTGTAAMGMMSQAIMEASIPIAQQDAQFFQTLTVKNLDNKQTMTINKANVLAKMEQMNLDNRMAAVIQNSQNFMQMDLANLSNEQQARVINTQSRVQAILEDQKAVNTQRMFTAQSQNDMNKFYDELNTNINKFNSEQVNTMKMFNADQTNKMAQFNGQLENNREQFYMSNQYNIDVANAKWRQTVATTNNENAFTAAATDVKNMVGISAEMLNQIWDRSDSLLDYIWKSSESSQDRALQLTIANIQSQTSKDLQSMKADAADNAGFGQAVGSVLGNLASNESFTKGIGDFIGGLF